MIGITGIGPRVGTSYILQEAIKQNIPIAADNKFIPWVHVEQQNPDGYWEVDPLEVNNGIHTDKYKGRLLKLWSHVLLQTPSHLVKRVLFIERKNKAAQRESILRTLTLEEEQLGVKTNLTADSVLQAHTINIFNWLKSKPSSAIKIVYTEELTERLDEIFNFIKGEN